MNTNADIRIRTDGPTDWVVEAIWYGEWRVVFRGDVFACCRYARTI